MADTKTSALIALTAVLADQDADYLVALDSSGAELKKILVADLFNSNTPAWTPTIAFGGGSTGVTYAARTVEAVKLGDLVMVSAYILLSSKGTDTGDATIEAMPYTQGAGIAVASVRVNDISFADVIQGHMPPSTTQILLSEVTNAGVISQITDANFTDTSSIMFSMLYKAA